MHLCNKIKKKWVYVVEICRSLHVKFEADKLIGDVSVSAESEAPLQFSDFKIQPTRAYHKYITALNKTI